MAQIFHVAGLPKETKETKASPKAAPRDILTPADIKFVQALAPPAKSAVPAAATTPAAPANAWTMTTLWPLAKDATPAPRKCIRRSHKTPA